MASTPPKSSSNSISSPDSIVFDIDTTLIDQIEDHTAGTSESSDKYGVQESSSAKKAKPPKTYLNLSLPQPIGEAEVLACLEKIQSEGGWEKTMLHGKKKFFSTMWQTQLVSSLLISILHQLLYIATKQIFFLVKALRNHAIEYMQTKSKMHLLC